MKEMCEQFARLLLTGPDTQLSGFNTLPLSASFPHTIKIEEIDTYPVAVFGSGFGIRCFFDPWIRDRKKSGSGSEMNIPDHFSESLENSDPGSEINIPDSQHCPVAVFGSMAIFFRPPIFQSSL